MYKRIIPVWENEECWSMQLITLIRVSGEITKLHSSSLEKEGYIHIILHKRQKADFS